MLRCCNSPMTNVLTSGPAMGRRGALAASLGTGALPSYGISRGRARVSAWLFTPEPSRDILLSRVSKVKENVCLSAQRRQLINDN